MSFLKSTIRALWAVTLVAALAAGGAWLLRAPGTPVPPEWNPLRPLSVAAPLTPLTGMKLRRALLSPETCQAALAPAAAATPQPPKVDGPRCGIDPRVALARVGAARLSPGPALETTCAVALRLALWEHHVVQPAAATHLGQSVTALRHQGSYNCRMIRGSDTRMSTHATAQAIDIKGVVLSDGATLDLRGNYDGDSPEARFFKALRNGACDWFVTTLGPEFNALHADHFHLQSTGWGTCR